MTREIACHPDSGGDDRCRIQAYQVIAVSHGRSLKTVEDGVEQLAENFIALEIRRIDAN